MWEMLVTRYNALILMITTDKTDMEIFNMKGVFRKTKGNMKYSDEEGSVYKTGERNQTGRAMRELLLPAKATLLSECDVYFVQNPNQPYI